MKRENFSSGGKWEDIVGYSRAVKVGNLIEVAGTTAANEKGEDYVEATKTMVENMQREDAREGINAFLKKSDMPEWQDR